MNDKSSNIMNGKYDTLKIDDYFFIKKINNRMVFCNGDGTNLLYKHDAIDDDNVVLLASNLIKKNTLLICGIKKTDINIDVDLNNLFFFNKSNLSFGWYQLISDLYVNKLTYKNDNCSITYNSNNHISDLGLNIHDLEKVPEGDVFCITIKNDGFEIVKYNKKEYLMYIDEDKITSNYIALLNSQFNLYSIPFYTDMKTLKYHIDNNHFSNEQIDEHFNQIQKHYINENVGFILTQQQKNTPRTPKGTPRTPRGTPRTPRTLYKKSIDQPMINITRELSIDEFIEQFNSTTRERPLIIIQTYKKRCYKQHNDGTIRLSNNHYCNHRDTTTIRLSQNNCSKIPCD